MGTSASAGRRRRILMLLGNNPYPQDERVSYESRTLVRGGYRVAVVCQHARGQPWKENVHGVEVYRYPNPVDAQGFLGYVLEYGAATAAAILLGLRVRLDGPVDAVHAHNPPDTLVLASALFKLAGKRIVFDHHDIAPEMYHARFEGRGNRVVHRALLLFERLSCRLADHVIATNESYRRIEIERDGVSPENVTVVRNGPNLDRLSPVEADAELRSRAGTLIGFAGVMGYQDGVDHLIRAIAHLVHDLGHTNCLCVLIGKGDAQEDCRRLANTLRVEDHVWFTGFVPDSDLVVPQHLRHLRRPGSVQSVHRPVHDGQDDGVHGAGQAGRSVRPARTPRDRRFRRALRAGE